MYLSSLKLNGFKSFPQGSHLKFNGGITVIVGPNGCGKTNIVDSIRWVLGEQRVSLLRGEKMEEVIFNGTSELKPLGMAEVSLEFDNAGGLLPIDYNEVLITRRLYRSGESEYLLNKQPCRLKDITNLIVNTGIGPHAYSVIQQNMVEAILSEKTDDRRFLFEEAAGISSYKLRRRETLRKLDTVSSDLIRINDISLEIEKQANSLKRQSTRAGHFRELSDRFKQAQVVLIGYSFSNIQGTILEKQVQKDSMTDKISDIKTRMSQISAETEEKKLGATRLNGALQELASELAPIESELIENEKQYSINEQRRAFLNENYTRISAELEKSKERLHSLGVQEGELRRQIGGIDEACHKAQVEFSTFDGELLSAENQLEFKRKEILPIQDSLESAGGRLASERSNNEALIDRLKEYNSRMNDLLLKKHSTLEKTSFTENRKSELEDEKQKIARSIEQFKSEKSAIEMELSELTSKMQILQKQILAESNRHSSLLARLETLRELKSSYEGYREGSRCILNEAADKIGIAGAIADRLRIPAELLHAAESALGQDAELILCHALNSAMESIDLLCELKKGTAGFWIENEPSAESPALAEISDGISSLPGFEGRLNELLGEGSSTSLHRILFGNIILMNNRDAAIEAAGLLAPGLSIVTRSGELFRWGGIISGGSFGSDSSIVGRETAIDTLSNQLNELDDRMRSLQTQASESTAIEMGLKTKLSDVEDQWTLAILRMGKLEQEVSSLNADKMHLQENLDSISNEVSELQAKLASTEGLLQNSNQKILTFVEEYESLKAELTGRTSRLEVADFDFRKMTRDVNAAKVNVINLQSEKIRFESELRNNLELQERTRENISQYEGELNRSSVEMKELEKKKEILAAAIKADGQQKEILVKRIGEIKGEYAAIETAISNLESQLSSLRRENEAHLKQEHELDMAIAEAEGEMRYLAKKALEEYGLDIKSIPPPEGELDPVAADLEIKTIEEKIQRLGPINMLALEEYEKARDRFDFITKQKTDLTDSRDSLKQVIRKINQTAAEKFLTTFELIRQNFKNVFKELFEGGEADVILTDIKDPLECPIDITASPRGKKIFSLAQLSGGERALTSIALLFGIYFVKPSPFCILDEVDAPLDDVNLQRFLKVLKKFAVNTQFIIITHNKLTMDAANTLYGVTMEKPGVSKLVSVRLEELTEKDLTLART